MPDAGKTTENEFCCKFSLTLIPKEADSDKTVVLLMNSYVRLVAVHLTNTLF